MYLPHSGAMDHAHRLGEAVRRRRLTLGMSQRELARRAGLKSKITVSAVERGGAGRARDSTLYGLDRALSWPPGSAELMLQTGAEPTPLDQPAPPEFTDPVEQQLWAIRGLSPERRLQLIQDHRAEQAATQRSNRTPGRRRSKAS